MSCAICETRRPRRYCLGVRGDICTICCGTEREVTVDCPFECVYLQDARRHERPAPLKPEDLPSQEVPITEAFLERNGQLLIAVVSGLLRASEEIPGLIDYDVREALAALARTLKTEQSGLHYQTLPQNPVAGACYRLVQEAINEFRQAEREQLGMTRTRDSDILGAVIFFRRLEAVQNNGRRRGRAFLHHLRSEVAPAASQPRAVSSLIVP